MSATTIEAATIKETGTTLETTADETMANRNATRSPETAPAPSRPREPVRLREGIERLVLTGFMGSGKTTVGRLLAERLGWAFRDLDAEIERRCGMTVPQIFSELGEAHFRRQETAALASVLGASHAVIALGGGAPEELGNRLLLEQMPATAIIYLDAPFATLYDRCAAQASLPGATARPVLADRQRAEARFALRQRSYRRIAGHTLDTTQTSPEETAEALLRKLARAAPRAL